MLQNGRILIESQGYDQSGSGSPGTQGSNRLCIEIYTQDEDVTVHMATLLFCLTSGYEYASLTAVKCSDLCQLYTPGLTIRVDDGVGVDVDAIHTGSTYLQGALQLLDQVC